MRVPCVTVTNVPNLLVGRENFIDHFFLLLSYRFTNMPMGTKIQLNNLVSHLGRCKRRNKTTKS